METMNPGPRSLMQRKNPEPRTERNKRTNDGDDEEPSLAKKTNLTNEDGIEKQDSARDRDRKLWGGISISQDLEDDGISNITQDGAR
jgi:hypothetical protein